MLRREEAFSEQASDRNSRSVALVQRNVCMYNSLLYMAQVRFYLNCTSNTQLQHRFNKNISRAQKLNLQFIRTGRKDNRTVKFATSVVRLNLQASGFTNYNINVYGFTIKIGIFDMIINC